MISFLFFLFGGISGLIVHRYATEFIPNLQRDIYQSYIECYPESPPNFDPKKAAFQPKKCGHFFLYFFFFSILAVSLYSLLQHPALSLWLFIICTICLLIGLLDWYYQLIPTELCLILFFIGLFGAEQQFSSQPLVESLQSAVIFWGTFYLIYHLAKYFYRREALGRGDYWLMLGLGTFLKIEQLPTFLFLACGFGIIVALLIRCRSIPFAPCLCAATFTILLISNTNPSMILLR
ncbi:prepilin peptidase [Rodentibacter caecimuris]|uniref:Prepilin peptidase n=1 Tax=Rodentibacter caecimuris TaxID=1796644 RepID=A0ABX3L0J2_9PAST|nr:prepilin peptidase [Rodentibacter heylii]